MQGRKELQGKILDFYFIVSNLVINSGIKGLKVNKNSRIHSEARSPNIAELLFLHGRYLVNKALNRYQCNAPLKNLLCDQINPCNSLNLDSPTLNKMASKQKWKTHGFHLIKRLSSQQLHIIGGPCQSKDLTAPKRPEPRQQMSLQCQLKSFS